MKNLFHYIETELLSEGEITFTKLQLQARRNWGLGPRAVKTIVDEMVQAKRAKKDDLCVYRFTENAPVPGPERLVLGINKPLKKRVRA